MLSNSIGPCNARLVKVKFYVFYIGGKVLEKTLRDIMKRVFKFIFSTVVRRKRGDKMQLSLTTISLMIIWVFKAKFINYTIKCSQIVK